MARLHSGQPERFQGRLVETSFADNDAIDPFHRAGVAYCFSNGIITGIGNNNFAPKRNVLFQEAVAMMARTLGRVITEEYPIGEMRLAASNQAGLVGNLDPFNLNGQFDWTEDLTRYGMAMLLNNYLFNSSVAVTEMIPNPDGNNPPYILATVFVPIWERFNNDRFGDVLLDFEVMTDPEAEPAPSRTVTGYILQANPWNIEINTIQGRNTTLFWNVSDARPNLNHPNNPTDMVIGFNHADWNPLRPAVAAVLDDEGEIVTPAILATVAGAMDSIAIDSRKIFNAIEDYLLVDDGGSIFANIDYEHLVGLKVTFDAEIVVNDDGDFVRFERENDGIKIIPGSLNVVGEKTPVDITGSAATWTGDGDGNTAVRLTTITIDGETYNVDSRDGRMALNMWNDRRELQTFNVFRFFPNNGDIRTANLNTDIAFMNDFARTIRTGAYFLEKVENGADEFFYLYRPFRVGFRTNNDGDHIRFADESRFEGDGRRVRDIVGADADITTFTEVGDVTFEPGNAYFYNVTRNTLRIYGQLVAKEQFTVRGTTGNNVIIPEVGASINLSVNEHLAAGAIENFTPTDVAQGRFIGYFANETDAVPLLLRQVRPPAGHVAYGVVVNDSLPGTAPAGTNRMAIFNLTTRRIETITFNTLNGQSTDLVGGIGNGSYVRMAQTAQTEAQGYLAVFVIEPAGATGRENAMEANKYGSAIFMAFENAVTTGWNTFLPEGANDWTMTLSGNAPIAPVAIKWGNMSAATPAPQPTTHRVILGTNTTVVLYNEGASNPQDRVQILNRADLRRILLNTQSQNNLWSTGTHDAAANLRNIAFVGTGGGGTAVGSADIVFITANRRYVPVDQLGYAVLTGGTAGITVFTNETAPVHLYKGVYYDAEGARREVNLYNTAGTFAKGAIVSFDTTRERLEGTESYYPISADVGINDIGAAIPVSLPAPTTTNRVHRQMFVLSGPASATVAGGYNEAGHAFTLTAAPHFFNLTSAAPFNREMNNAMHVHRGPTGATPASTAVNVDMPIKGDDNLGAILNRASTASARLIVYRENNATGRIIWMTVLTAETVVGTAATSITITGHQPGVDLAVDSTRDLSLTRDPMPSPALGATTWTSSDISIATVSTAGVVTGVSEGTVTITASALRVAGSTEAPLTATATISVVAPNVLDLMARESTTASWMRVAGLGSVGAGTFHVAAPVGSAPNQTVLVTFGAARQAITIPLNANPVGEFLNSTTQDGTTNIASGWTFKLNGDGLVREIRSLSATPSTTALALSNTITADDMFIISQRNVASAHLTGSARNVFLIGNNGTTAVDFDLTGVGAPLVVVNVSDAFRTNLDLNLANDKIGAITVGTANVVIGGGFKVEGGTDQDFTVGNIVTNGGIVQIDVEDAELTVGNITNTSTAFISSVRINGGEGTLDVGIITVRGDITVVSSDEEDSDGDITIEDIAVSGTPTVARLITLTANEADIILEAAAGIASLTATSLLVDGDVDADGRLILDNSGQFKLDIAMGTGNVTINKDFDISDGSGDEGTVTLNGTGALRVGADAEFIADIATASAAGVTGAITIEGILDGAIDINHQYRGTMTLPGDMASNNVFEVSGASNGQTITKNPNDTSMFSVPAGGTLTNPLIIGLDYTGTALSTLRVGTINLEIRVLARAGTEEAPFVIEFRAFTP
jgi:hypothetical protein